MSGNARQLAQAEAANLEQAMRWLDAQLRDGTRAEAIVARGAVANRLNEVRAQLRGELNPLRGYVIQSRTARRFFGKGPDGHPWCDKLADAERFDDMPSAERALKALRKGIARADHWRTEILPYAKALARLNQQHSTGGDA